MSSGVMPSLSVDDVKVESGVMTAGTGSSAIVDGLSGALAGLELHVRLQDKEVWNWPITPPGGDPGRVYWRNRITAEAHLPTDE